MIKETEAGIIIDIPNYNSFNELQKTIALTYITKKLSDIINKLSYEANTIYQKISKDKEGMIKIEVSDTIKAKLKRNSARSETLYPKEIIEKEQELKEAKKKAVEDKTAKKITPTLDPKIDKLFKIHLQIEKIKEELDFSKYATV